MTDPQQYPAQPQNPGYPQGQPYPQYAAQPSTRPSGGSLGRIAFVLALVALGVGLVVNLFAPLFYASIGYDVADAISTVIGGFVLLANAAALVLGLIAIRRTPPHLLAAIAIGIAGASIAVRLASWVSNLFFYIGF
ncbi:hypothetical protein [Microbacterium sp. NPDC089695]|uniref:hypothetical protein n=1 Tax=Microbacterium sp. NPDC089695 TaxID=3364198 RepID=UPI0038114CA3